jgi:ATP synthase protein I
MAENEPEIVPLEEDARIKSLTERLQRAQSEEAARTAAPRSGPRPGQAQGMRILQELIGIPFGSALIGWVIDRFADTRPWVMLAMLFLGFGIAVRSVLREAKTPPR